MISFAAFNSKRNELEMMKREIKDLAALLTEDKWRMQFFDSISSFGVFVKDKPLIDLSCFDVSVKDSVDSLVGFRKDYEETMILLIADSTTMPTEYLRPGVRADSLMLRPYTLDTARSTFKTFVNAYLSKIESGDNSNSFIIDEKEGKTVIAYKDIYYFEAKEKKVFIRTLNEEFGFYATLDSLEGELPEEFLRCHRSFIVNKNMLDRVYLSQNYMELIDGFQVPLSRSYKPLFKGLP